MVGRRAVADARRADAGHGGPARTRAAATPRHVDDPQAPPHPHPHSGPEVRPSLYWPDGPARAAGDDAPPGRPRAAGGPRARAAPARRPVRRVLRRARAGGGRARRARGGALDQDAVAQAAGSTVSALADTGHLPHGERGRRDYRLALPRVEDAAVSGTTAAGRGATRSRRSPAGRSRRSPTPARGRRRRSAACSRRRRRSRARPR